MSILFHQNHRKNAETHRDHLDMALLELSLDMVEVRRVQVVSLICLDNILLVDGARLFEGSRVFFYCVLF